MKNEFTWTIKKSLRISDIQWKIMLTHVIKENWSIERTVEHFLSSDDTIYYTIPEDVINAIQDELTNKIKEIEK